MFILPSQYSNNIYIVTLMYVQCIVQPLGHLMLQLPKTICRSL